MSMQNTIAVKLSTLSIEYGTSHSDADLALLADDWAKELAGERPASVAAALDLHRRECSRFPTLAQVLALLPRCRVVSAAPALPESTLPHVSRARDIRDALRGDGAARARMNALMRRVGAVC